MYLINDHKLVFMQLFFKWIYFKINCWGFKSLLLKSLVDFEDIDHEFQCPLPLFPLKNKRFEKVD